MRQITSAAGVNLAAVNYHFGSKEALVQAVLKRRLEEVNRERLRLLDELRGAAGGTPLAVADVDAFSAPAAPGRQPPTTRASPSCPCSNVP